MRGSRADRRTRLDPGFERSQRAGSALYRGRVGRLRGRRPSGRIRLLSDVRDPPMLESAEEATAMEDLTNVEWRRSPYCETNECVETAEIAERPIIRDSKDPDG